MILDTNARTSEADDPGSCTVQPLFNDTTSVRVPAGGAGLELMQIYLPFAWYSVDDLTNTIVIRDPAVPLTLVTMIIPAATYTASSFATWLQTTLNTQGGGVLGVTTWLVSYDASTGKLSVSNTSAQEFEWAGSVNSFTAEDILGLQKDTNYVSVNASITGPRISQTLHTPYVHVIIGWEGLRTLVTAKTETTPGITFRQSGYKQEIAIMKAPPVWLQNCEGNFINKPKWLINTLPSNVRMELFSHDWKPINMNGINWAVYFQLRDMPGERLSDNHIIMADPETRTVLSNAAPNLRSDSLVGVKHPLGRWAGEQRGMDVPAINSSAITEPMNKRINWKGPSR